MAAVPVFYVHGNHDECYDTHPPEGVTCLDDRVVVYNGLRIAGLGGACRYRTGAWQFTEAEMKKRVNRLRARIGPLRRAGRAGDPCAAARVRRYDRPGPPGVYRVP